MNIVITGGAGFVGSHLAGHLIAQGHRVHVVDDLSTGRKENLAHLPADRLTLTECAVADLPADGSWADGVDQVYHLAAAVGVKLIVDEPVKSIENNVMEAVRVFRAAADRHIPTLLTSSSEVYGKTGRVPFGEDDDVTYGATVYSRWSYAMAKALDEHLALAHHGFDGLPAVVVRLFNTVGPGQVGQYGMVIPRFIEKALANEPIDVYGDGRQSRCFCHVGDVVDALPRLLAEPACAGRVFNLGSDEEVSIDGLADRVIEGTGSTGGKRYVPYEKAYATRFDDLQRRVPDLTRVRQAIGFEPSKKLDAILKELIELRRNGAPFASNKAGHA